MIHRLNFSEYVFVRNQGRDSTAYIDQHGSISYRELESRSRGLAQSLSQIGIVPGDHVMISHPDDRYAVISFLAVLLSGAVAVMVNSRCSREYFDQCVKQSQPQWIISGDSTLTAAQQHRPDHVISSLDLVPLSEPGDFATADTLSTDPAYWLFTSGTTGSPRAVIHSHGNLLAVGKHYGQLTDGMTNRDIVYATAKLSFAYGMCHSLAATLVSGATAILTTKLPMPETIMATIAQHRPTIFVTVPTVYAMLLNNGVDLSDLGIKQCTSAGEDLALNLQQRWHDATGVPLLNLYGCTEFSGCVLANHLNDQAPGTVGRPTWGYRCELRDRDGNAVSLGEVGELWAQGPSLALGYHDDPMAFASGWFRSRDLFYQDLNGRYVFQGRCDDMLKVNGQWVSPIEIENVLLERDDIQEVGVAGTATPDGLIEIVAHVVPTSGAQINEGDIRSHVRRRLDLHKCPRHVRIVDHLPRTMNGKLQRSRLEQTA